MAGGPPTLTVTRHRSISEIPASLWDAVTEEAGFYGSHAWLDLYEGSPATLDGLEPCMVAVRRGDEIVALAATYFAASAGKLSFNGDFARLSLSDETSRPPYAESDLYPIVYSGSPMGFSNRLYLSPRVVDPALRKEVLRSLLDGVRVAARERGTRLVTWGHLPGRDAAALLELDPRLASTLAMIDCSVDVPSTFDEYLARLNRQHRKEVRVFAEEGLRMEIHTIGEVMEDIVPLFVGNLDKYGIHGSEGWFRPRLERMVSAGLDSKVFCAILGGRIVGATLSLRRGNMLALRMWGGLPDAAPRRAAVYFNCVFYAPTRFAVDAGIKAIHLGGGSLGAKASRGTRIEPVWWVLDFLQPEMPSPAVVSWLRERDRRLLDEHEKALRSIGWSDDEIHSRLPRAPASEGRA